MVRGGSTQGGPPGAVVQIYYKLKASGVAVVCAQLVATISNGLVLMLNGGDGVEEWRQNRNSEQKKELLWRKG